jgi:WD40 repeat protein
MKTYLFFLALIGLFIFFPLSINAQDENTLDSDYLTVMTAENAAEISEISRLEQKTSVSDVTFSTNGNNLASTSFHSGVGLWDIRQLQEPLTFIGGNFLTVSFSPNGGLMAAGGRDFGEEGCECTIDSVHLYDATTYQQRAVLVGLGSQGDTDINHLAFDKDGKHLVTVDGSVGLWDIEQALQLGRLDIHDDMRMIQNYNEHPVWNAAFSPDGMLLAYTTSKNVYKEGKFMSSDHQIVLWDLSTHSELRVLQGHTNKVRVVVFSPDSSLLASGSGELIGYQDNYAPIYGDDNTVSLWNVETGEQIVVLDFESEISNLVFSPDGKLLAVGDYGHIHIVDVKNGIELAVLNGHTGIIEGLAFSPDGKLLASGGDSTIRLWGVPSN